MADFMRWMDRKYLYAQDLEGDTVVEFERVVPGAVDTKGGKRKLPIAYFKGIEKPLGLVPTNCRTIKKLFGDRDEKKMPGRRITLYVTTTDTADGMQDCIRIRPTLPPDEKPAKQPPRQETKPPTNGPAGTQPLSEDEAKLRKAYGAEFKSLAAILQLTPEKIKERYGDLRELSTERLGEICADLERERATTS